MQLIDLLKALLDAKIRHLLVGGIAVNLYGIERPTKDVDLVVYLEKENLRRFLILMDSLGYRPRIPVDPFDFADPKKRADWAKSKNMVVFSFFHQRDMMNVVDVFVKHPLPFEGLYKRRELIPFGKMKLSVISIPDLIKLKKKANRLQDQADIRALQQVLEIRKNQKKK